MKVNVYKLYDKNGTEVGSILKASINSKTTNEQKLDIEEKLKHHAHDNIYPGVGVLIYSVYYVDTASIVVLKGTESLDVNEVNIQ